jgi:hypothetical protein
MGTCAAAGALFRAAAVHTSQSMILLTRIVADIEVFEA